MGKKRKSLIILFTIFLTLSLLATSFVVCAQGTGRSYQAVIVDGVFKLLGLSDAKNDPEREKKLIENLRKKNEDYTVPKIYMDYFKLKSYTIDDFQVVVFNENATSGKYIFYLHGGAFTEQPLLFHYGFLKAISTELDCTVVMPIYPKAPNYTYETTISMVTNTYTELLTRINSNDITIMGDSAGASMSLSLCQYFKTINIPQPKDIIIFSPAMDGKFDNPKISEYTDRDLMLAPMSLISRVKSYAGSEENITNYLVSPIYGDFTNLAPITLFIGSEEVLLPDVRLFVERAKEEQIELTCYEGEKMQHVYPIYPIPESKEVRKLIKEIILG